MTDAPLVVAIDASPLRHQRTGVGRYVEQLVAHMPIAAVRRLVLTNRPGELPAGVGPVAGPGRPARPTAAWRQVAVPRLLRDSAAGVAHFTAGQAPLRAGLPTVVTVHDISLLDHPELYAHRERLLVAPWLRRSVPRADAVIAVSQDTADAVRRRWPHLDVPVHVIPEGPAPVFRHQRRTTDRADLRARLGLEHRVWLHVGAQDRRKNLTRLLTAFAEAVPHAGLPHPQLALVGPAGDDTRAIQRRARHLRILDRVRLVDYVTSADLASLYAAAELVVVASLHEGFGLVAVEAMASGTPVVASDRGAHREVTRGAAWLIDPTSTDDLAAGLIRVAGDHQLQRTLSRRGRRQAAHFDWSETASRTVSVYRSVAGRARDPAQLAESVGPA